MLNLVQQRWNWTELGNINVLMFHHASVWKTYSQYNTIENIYEQTLKLWLKEIYISNPSLLLRPKAYDKFSVGIWVGWWVVVVDEVLVAVKVVFIISLRTKTIWRQLQKIFKF